MSRASQHQPASQHAPAMLWLVLLFIVFAGFGLKLYWDVEEYRIERHRESVVYASDQRYQALLKILQDPVLKGASSEQVRQAIGARQPFQLINLESSSFSYAEWTDPSSQAFLFLHFDKRGRFTNANVHWHPPNVPQVSSYSGATQEDFRRAGVLLAPQIGNFHWPLAYVPWLVLYIEYRRRPHRRGIIAFLLVSWTVLTVLLWLMGSERLLSLDGLLDHQPNFWGVILLVFTWVVLTYGGFRNRYADPEACKQCGYSLKGNTSGACPECGEVIKAVEQRLDGRVS